MREESHIEDYLISLIMLRMDSGQRNNKRIHKREGRIDYRRS